ncbi:MAG: PEP-CTERM sorting domain-containing protein [Cyanobacteria bacterium J06627_8]
MKRITMMISCLIAGATIVLSGTQASAVNLVRNGGFDDFELSEGKRGARTNWNFFDGQYLEENQAELGWQVTDGSTLEVRRDGVAGRSHNGSRNFAELDAHAYSVGSDEEIGIFQDIATQIGKKYRLSFAYAARPGVNGDRNQFETLFGDVFTQQFDGGNGRTQDGRTWKTFSTQVVASSDITRLQFNYLGRRDTLGAHIDSVSVEKVPEPASLLGLLVVGVVGAGTTAKQKQKSAM